MNGWRILRKSVIRSLKTIIRRKAKRLACLLKLKKCRLNSVFNAIRFIYPDYSQLSQGRWKKRKQRQVKVTT